MTGIALMQDKTQSPEQTGAISIAQLIARARSGDLTAFDQIMIRHQQRVISLAWRILGNREDARDATQETFLRVYRHLNKFDPAQDFSGWLYRIAVNVCRDLGRKRARVSHSPLEFEMEPASHDNTERSAMNAQEQRLILEALAALPEKERAAIVLRDLEGFETDEVARILGSSPTTVRSQISSARMKLKQFRERLQSPSIADSARKARPQ